MVILEYKEAFSDILKMKIFDNLNIRYIVFFFFIILSSIIKLNHIDKIYHELDDIGILANHKHYPEDKTIQIFQKKFTIKKELIQNLENSYLFPLYIAINWTYSPGQFFFYYLIDFEEKDFFSKIFFAKIISFFSSLISVVIFFIFCDRFVKSKYIISLFLSLVLFNSYNFSIYSLHMSPYSTYFLSTTIALILIYKSLYKKNILPLITINSFLIYFSYMNFLFFFPLMFVSIYQKKIKFNLLLILGKKIKYLLLNFLLLLPIVLIFFIKSNISYSRGFSISGVENFLDKFEIIILQLNKAFGFLFPGLLPDFKNLNFIYLLMFIFVNLIFFLKKKNKNLSFLVFLLFTFFIWIFLFFFNFLPLDASRHSLIFFPILLACLAISLSIVKNLNIPILILLIICYPISLQNIDKVLTSKKSNFDYNFIKNQKVKNLIIYSGSTGVKLFFDKSYKIYDFNLGTYNAQNLITPKPKRALLISQDMSYEDYIKLREKNKNDPLKFFLKNYSVKEIKNIKSDIYMSYQNNTIVSNQNGFYIYEINLKD